MTPTDCNNPGEKIPNKNKTNKQAHEERTAEHANSEIISLHLQKKNQHAPSGRLVKRSR
jgi:hypothetical protein